MPTPADRRLRTDQAPPTRGSRSDRWIEAKPSDRGTASALSRTGPSLLSLDEALTYSGERAREFVALDDAIDQLARINERSARVVELRFFTGLSVEETAAVMEVSESSVARDHRFAMAFLADQLSSA